MFSRKVITSLREWAADEDRKPLILRGARQVGKTTPITRDSLFFDGESWVYSSAKVSSWGSSPQMYRLNQSKLCLSTARFSLGLLIPCPKPL